MRKLSNRKRKIGIGLAAVLLLEYYRYYNSEEYKKYFHFANKMKRVSQCLHIVNLGTTGAYYAFDYSKLKVPAMNMAIYTQPFSYDLKILKKYKKRISEGAIILITLEYPIFLFPEIPGERKEVHNQFCKILGPETKKIKDIVKCYFFQAFPFLIRKYYSSIFYMINLEKLNSKKNHFTVRDRKILIYQKIKGWCEASGIEQKDWNNGRISENIKKNMINSQCYLNNLLDFCMDSNWRPVLVALPYSEDMNNMLNEDLLDRIFYQNLNVYKARGIPFLDYSSNHKLKSGDLYMDMEYLNETGKKLFTNLVIEDLKAMQFYTD